ncbi:MAG: hypothetical protein MHM6MM_002805 [Cercozoa sp. M6MM]
MQRHRGHRRSRSAQIFNCLDYGSIDEVSLQGSALSPSAPLLRIDEASPPPHEVASFFSARIAAVTEGLQALQLEWQQRYCSESPPAAECDTREAQSHILRACNEFVSTTKKLREKLLPEDSASVESKPSAAAETKAETKAKETYGPRDSTRHSALPASVLPVTRTSSRSTSSALAPRPVRRSVSARGHISSKSVAILPELAEKPEFRTHTNQNSPCTPTSSTSSCSEALSSETAFSESSSSPGSTNAKTHRRLGSHDENELRLLAEISRLRERVMDRPRLVGRQIALLRHMCANNSVLLHSAFVPSSGVDDSPEDLSESALFSEQWDAEAKLRRSGKSKQLLRALRQLEECTRHMQTVLQHTRILCIEPSAATSGTSHLIQFAFPGFDTFVCHVGSAAVISAEGRSLAASDESAGAAKELMLAIPEKTKKPREHMRSCVLNLVTAQFLNAHLSEVRHTLLKEHNAWTFSFSDVINTIVLEAHEAGQDAIANEKLLWQNASVDVRVNPSVSEALRPSAAARSRNVLDPLRFLRLLRGITVRRLEALGAAHEAFLAYRQRRRKSSGGSLAAVVGRADSKQQLLDAIGHAVRQERRQLHMTLHCLGSMALDDLIRYASMHMCAVVEEHLPRGQQSVPPIITTGVSLRVLHGNEAHLLTRRTRVGDSDKKRLLGPGMDRRLHRQAHLHRQHRQAPKSETPKSATPCPDAPKSETPKSEGPAEVPPPPPSLSQSNSQEPPIAPLSAPRPLSRLRLRRHFRGVSVDLAGMRMRVLSNEDEQAGALSNSATTPASPQLRLSIRQATSP